jgi:8-oxo-dGTP pyrophosphatase MutT (NUDIX family)
MTDEQGYEGVTHAGIAVVRADGSPMVLLAQRALDETDAEGVQNTWEFPGGAIQPDEDPQAAAMREFEEELGFPLPEGEVVDGWRAGEGGRMDPEGHYQGFVYVASEFPDVQEWEPTTEVAGIGWIDAPGVGSLAESGALRPELVESDAWALVWGAVSGNEQQEEPEMDPELEMADVEPPALMVHGILAPEDAPSGDGRGFNEGALTARPLRLPFGWQKYTAPGHEQAVTVGSIDRVMRKDGLIHWEGSLLPTAEADEFVDLLLHFGRYGVSIDADRGSADQDRSKAENMTWFEAGRIAGAVAVSIPAFAEAYVALGPHPDMPEAGSDEANDGTLMAGARVETFKRGAGWVTDPVETKRIHDYWTKKGEEGYAKVAWGTPGDFRRAKALIGAKIAKNSPEKMKYLNQIIAQWHFDALGYWPGDLDKPGNKTTAEAKAEREAKKALAAQHGITAGEGTEWEAVLVSSAAGVSGPPAEYFDFHPDSGALVIEEPDANGFRRTYGYAAEWGVCHIGYGNKCVEPPSDPDGGDYRDFHLGRTTVEGGGHLATGVITYKVDHRDAATILSQTAEQQHFDNIAHAWAAVRLGENERGVWFSGVVLPGIEANDITLIQATGQVSGEWRHGSMRALQAVNVPGFPVMRSSAVVDEETGEVLALSASAFGDSRTIEVNGVETSPCIQDDPVGDLALAVIDRIEAKSRMERLAEADAARRFAALKERGI